MHMVSSQMTNYCPHKSFATAKRKSIRIYEKKNYVRPRCRASFNLYFSQLKLIDKQNYNICIRGTICKMEERQQQYNMIVRYTCF
jgi:hypothetical protein